MDLVVEEAAVSDAPVVGSLVAQLIREIEDRANVTGLQAKEDKTARLCQNLLEAGRYAALIGFVDGHPVAVATMAETCALYAGGTIGIIQEFYVLPEHRSSGVGTQLLQAVRSYGLSHGWRCIELCTPPLPVFEKTLNFYQRNGLAPVGGRKMRLALAD